MIGICITGRPVTKKNSQRLIVAGGRPRIIPSEAYQEYEQRAMWQIPRELCRKVDTPVNVRCVYHMPDARKVDLCNLLAATCDILVAAGVLADDNCRIVAGHDGSRVLVDRQNPRVDIEITEATA